MSEEFKKRHGGSFFVPGFLLIGLGVGIIIKNAGAGVLLGLGVGFVVWGIFKIFNR